MTRHIDTLRSALTRLVQRIDYYAKEEAENQATIEGWQYTQNSSDMQRARAALSATADSLHDQSMLPLCTACGWNAIDIADETCMLCAKRASASASNVDAQLAAMTAERDALAKDAARYRWLRDVGDSTYTAFANHPGYDAMQADRHIDASIAATQGEPAVIRELLTLDELIELIEKSEWVDPETDRKQFDHLGFARAVENRVRAIFAAALAAAPDVQPKPKFDQAEFDEMVCRGTVAWAGVDTNNIYGDGDAQREQDAERLIFEYVKSLLANDGNASSNATASMVNYLANNGRLLDAMAQSKDPHHDR